MHPWLCVFTITVFIIIPVHAIDKDSPMQDDFGDICPELRPETARKIRQAAYDEFKAAAHGRADYSSIDAATRYCEFNQGDVTTVAFIDGTLHVTTELQERAKLGFNRMVRIAPTLYQLEVFSKEAKSTKWHPPNSIFSFFTGDFNDMCCGDLFKQDVSPALLFVQCLPRLAREMQHRPAGYFYVMMPAFILSERLGFDPYREDILRGVDIVKKWRGLSNKLFWRGS